MDLVRSGFGSASGFVVQPPSPFPTSERRELGHGADAALSYVRVPMSLAQQEQGENAPLLAMGPSRGGPVFQARMGSFDPVKAAGGV